jgi:group I intron endonuclease
MVGIYKIISPSNKIYIGQSVNIEKRWIHYRLLDCEKQPKIYRSILKYGLKNHIFEIIEECSIEQLNEKEIYYKQQIVNKFGWEKVLFCEIYDGGGGPKSEKTKEKISKANKGISRNKGNKNRLGAKLSQLSKDKISKSSLGVKNTQKHNKNISEARLGIKFSQEHIDNMSQSRFKYSIICLETNTTYKSANQASKNLNIPPASIIKVCKEIYKQIKGYTFKFTDDAK